MATCIEPLRPKATEWLARASAGSACMAKGEPLIGCSPSETLISYRPEMVTVYSTMYVPLAVSLTWFGFGFGFGFGSATPTPTPAPAPTPLAHQPVHAGAAAAERRPTERHLGQG